MADANAPAPNADLADSNAKPAAPESAPLPVIMPEEPAVILPEPRAPKPRDDVKVHLAQAFNLRVPEGNGRYKIVPLRRGENVIDRAITKLPEWAIVKKLIVAPPPDLKTVPSTRAQALAQTFPLMTTDPNTAISQAARAQAVQARRILDAQAQADAFAQTRPESDSSAPELATAAEPNAPSAEAASDPSPKTTMKPSKAKVSPAVAQKLESADTPVNGMK